jgi:citrate lyase subunit beta/citryl-CoA lyase
MEIDGKTLIHSAQFDAANEAYSPTSAQFTHAQTVVGLFETLENLIKNAIQLDGEMDERLKLKTE